MLKKEFVEMMKNDEELQELRRKVYSITGQLNDICFRYGGPNSCTYEEWKDCLRKIVEFYEKKGRLPSDLQDSINPDPMRTDEELQDLRRRASKIPGSKKGMMFILGKDTYDGYKERLRSIVEAYEKSQRVTDDGKRK